MKRNSCLTALAVALLSLSSEARTYYLRERAEYPYPLESPETWNTKTTGSDGSYATAFGSEHTYAIAVRKEMYLEKPSSGPFLGGKLRIGASQPTYYGILSGTGNSVSFSDGGVVFGNGYIKPSTNANTVSTIDGPLTNLQDYAAYPPGIAGGAKGGILKVTGAFTSAEDKKCIVGYWWGERPSGYATIPPVDGIGLELGGDASGFLGTITVTSDWTCVTSEYRRGSVLKGGTITMGGNVELAFGGTIMAATSNDVFTVNNLSFESGSSLMVQHEPGSGKCGLVSVVGAVSHDGAINVVFEKPVTSDDYGKSYKIMSLPAESALSEADFEYAKVDGDAAAAFAEFSIVENAGGGDDVIVRFDPMVTLEHRISGVKQSSSTVLETYGIAYTNGNWWSDHEATHENAHYQMTVASVFSGYPVEYEFPGLSLGLAGSKYVTKTTTNICERLYLVDTVTFAMCSQGNLSLFGNYDTRSFLTQVVGYSGTVLNIYSAICGDGNFQISGYAANQAATKWAGRLGLYGDNSAWTGKLDTIASSFCADADESRHHTVAINNDNSLGGARSEFTYDALRLRRFATLSVVDDVRLAPGLNAGIFIDTNGIFSVEAEKRFECHWPISLCGNLYKAGAGTAMFGGELSFIDAENLSPTLFVRSGSVGVLDAAALDGLTIDMTPAKSQTCSLLVDFSAATNNAALKAYGIKNTAALPFAAGVEIPVAFSGCTAEVLSALRGTAEPVDVGYLTVRAEVADQVEALLVLPAARTLSVPGQHCRYVRNDNVDGDFTTFAVRIEDTPGIMLIVR